MGLAMTWNWFFLFPWQYRYLLHTSKSIALHYKLIGTYDRMIIPVIAVFSRHSSSAYYGLDQIIIVRTTKQLCSSSLWKAPRYYMSLYTPLTHTRYVFRQVPADPEGAPGFAYRVGNHALVDLRFRFGWRSSPVFLWLFSAALEHAHIYTTFEQAEVST